MDALTDKQYRDYSYLSRYSTFPFYYHKRDRKYIYGITNWLDDSTSYVLHNVEDTDTLDTLALHYYGRPDYFWIIASYNHIRDPYIKLNLKYDSIKIPSRSTIKYEDSD